MPKYYNKIPTWSPSKQWHYSYFETKEKWKEFVKSLFKEPGKYAFDETAFEFNKHARKFNKDKLFCEAPEGSHDYIDYWDTEKEKCRKGAIYYNDKGGVWYLPRFYYHWINFLRIYRKAPPKGFHFPDVRDVQYHMALYEMLAELHDKNSAVLKKRQIASSYFHIAKIYNRYIFEDGFTAKILASNKQYIDATGSWKFLEEYHNFTNEYTAWACSNLPNKVFQWQQKVSTKTTDGRSVDIGTKATITGVTLDNDPVKGVGGAVDEIFYEEGGVAPTADITYNFMRAAMEEGGLVTGHFCIAGSVGDLGQCKPLQKFMNNPKAYDFYPVWSNLLDGNGKEGYTALFIPEQWGMPGTDNTTKTETIEDELPPLPNCIDEYGNSLVEKAVAALTERYEYVKKVKTASDYQYLVSQKPRNIAEAFATRTVSVFPIKHTVKQIRKIEEGEVYLKYVELERGDNGKIIAKRSEREPIAYNSSASAIMRMEDKKGCIVIHQHPGDNPEWGVYFWSADPVETGDTKTSESLASIYIYMNHIEVTRIDAEGNSTTFIEGDKLVAEWVGRYDDVNETNEQMSLLIEYYNAWGVSEKNKPSLNTYMILKKRTRHLAESREMLFDAELGMTDSTAIRYGWTNTAGTWKKILQYGVDSISEELCAAQIDENGKMITPARYGEERIPFINLLKEMQEYTAGGNFDRVIAYCALMAFVKVQQAKLGIKQRTERTEEKLKNSTTFTRNSFLRSIGQQNKQGSVTKVSPFRSIGLRK